MVFTYGGYAYWEAIEVLAHWPSQATVRANQTLTGLVAHQILGCLAK